MKKITVVFTTLVLLFTFSLISMAQYCTSTNTPDAEDWNCVIPDLSVFSDLRRAVAENDLEGVNDFYFSPGMAGYIDKDYLPNSVEAAKQVLDLFDECNSLILCFDGASNLLEKEYKISFYGGSVRPRYRISRWRIEGWYSESTAPILEGRTDPSFVLETVDGEDVLFFKGEGGGYMGQFVIPQGVMTVLFTKIEQSAAEVPPIDGLGDLYVASFSELTSIQETFPWLWIALPVGAVVIAGGAAFALLRKKRKSSV